MTWPLPNSATSLLSPPVIHDTAATWVDHLPDPWPLCVPSLCMHCSFLFSAPDDALFPITIRPGLRKSPSY